MCLAHELPEVNLKWTFAEMNWTERKILGKILTNFSDQSELKSSWIPGPTLTWMNSNFNLDLHDKKLNHDKIKSARYKSHLAITLRQYKLPDCHVLHDPNWSSGKLTLSQGFNLAHFEISLTCQSPLEISLINFACAPSAQFLFRIDVQFTSRQPSAISHVRSC